MTPAPVEVSEEQLREARKLAHAAEGDGCASHDELGWSHGWRCQELTDDIANLLAERDRAAELREREACAQELESIISCRDRECVCFDGDCERMKGVVESIRARSGKP